MTPSRSPEPPFGARILGHFLLRGKLAQGRLGPVWLASLNPPGIAGPHACVCVKELDHVPGELLRDRFDEAVGRPAARWATCSAAVRRHRRRA